VLACYVTGLENPTIPSPFSPRGGDGKHRKNRHAAGQTVWVGARRWGRVARSARVGSKMERMGNRGEGRLDYDAELRLHNDALRRAYEIGSEDRVLDIGCGAGLTTRDSARLASDGLGARR